MPQTILFAADLSDFTPYLLRYLGQIAQDMEGRVVVVHVFQGTDESDSTGKAAAKSSITQMLEDAFFTGLEGLARVEGVTVLSGDPAESILEASIKERADLILMGSRSDQREDQTALGSVAQSVLSRSRIPVHMVPLVKMAPLSLEKSA